MEEIQLVIDKKLIIEKSSNESKIQNMALDFLTPIVEVMEGGKSLPFTFDTGANTTALYADYFKLHKNRIERTAEKDSIKIGGAGGVKNLHVFQIPFSGKIGNSSFSLKNISVYEENPRETDGIYGNLGQDVLTQFDTLVLDFKEMQFLLKTGKSG
ncbi:MAG TPA: retropepsin-like aspartic protease, partial [Salinimicrobium sp.]|nr:retropepsin-like aspartic protease [Salinimicrobium sp.]